jgi:hypothetical protein
MIKVNMIAIVSVDIQQDLYAVVNMVLLNNNIVLSLILLFIM